MTRYNRAYKIITFFCLWLLTVVSLPVVAEESDNTEPVGIDEFTESMDALTGFFTLYWDESTGKVWLEIDRFEEEFLFVEALYTGIGSNAVGLDRGQLGNERVVHFERVGPTVLLVERNLDYRSLTDSKAEARAVEESFAVSVLWAAKIKAIEDGRVLVDATEWLLQDHHDVAVRLKRAEQGQFSLDEDRCAVYKPHTKSFPDNTELEATLTFSTKEPGRLVRETTPDPQSLTVRQRLSFIRLPDDQYEPRQFDPRCGMFSIAFADYAAPLDELLETRYVMRHRLQKKDPEAAVSDPVEPIVYYVDPGIPQPLRSAVIDGASWWAEAFEAAGFTNAFDVRIRPDSIDPLDARYNVIQWIHRSSRGWSYGSSIADPRTGEIIKGHVSLGSLRARHDRLLFDAYGTSQAQQGSSLHQCAVEAGPILSALTQSAGPDVSIEVALARLRQLSAHEIGHTLGLAHNFAASTYNRGSVMDYPAPLVRINDEDSTFDFSSAYAVGIAPWDKIAIRYGYSQLTDGANTDSLLDAVVQEAIRNDLLYISDRDARGFGAAHPLANLWDNGADPIVEMRRIMSVRRLALARLSPDHLLEGQPLSDLEKLLVPAYLSHRYQIQATAKSIGGMMYTYAFPNDGQEVRERVAPTRQNQALDALLRTLSPEALAIPKTIRDNLPPSAPGFYDNRGALASHTEPVFDEFAASEVAAKLTLSQLLQPSRLARLIQQHSEDQRFMSMDGLLERLLNFTWRKPTPSSRYELQISRVVQRAVVDQMLELAGNTDASPDVRAVVSNHLRALAAELDEAPADSPPDEMAHRSYIGDRIERFLRRPHPASEKPKNLPAPPGSPIGD